MRKITNIEQREVNGVLVTGQFVENCSIRASKKLKQELVSDLLKEYDSYFIIRVKNQLFYYGFNKEK